MKKTALFIVWTLSTPLFACWGGSRSEFWNDGVYKQVIAPVLTEAKKLQISNTIPTVPASVTSGSWGALYQYLKVSYLTNLLTKH